MTDTRKKRGQGIVELALVLPIFIFVFLGIVDFGRAFHSWSTINHMCVSAARVACKRQMLNIATNVYTPTTHASVEAVTAEFWKYISPLTPQSKITLDMVGVGTSGDTVTIKATVQFEPWFPFAGALMGESGSKGAITLSTVALQRKE